MEKNNPKPSRLGSAAGRAVAALLAAIYEPVTREWLKKHLPLLPNAQGLHIGCGSGEDTFLIDTLLNGQVELTAIDEDPVLVEAALQKPALEGRSNIHFSCANKTSWITPAQYDFCYARLLSTSLQEPGGLLHHIRRHLNPGGVLIAEVMGLSGFKVYPYNHAIARSMELIGALEEDQPGEEQWSNILQQTGFTSIETAYTHSAFIPREHNRILSLALEWHLEEILRRGLATGPELNAILQELIAFEQLPDVLASRPGVLQVSARNNWT